MVEEQLKRDIFLLRELDDASGMEVMKKIIEINSYDDEQEALMKEYERKPIKLHLCTPRRISYFCFWNM